MIFNILQNKQIGERGKKSSIFNRTYPTPNTTHIIYKDIPYTYHNSYNIQGHTLYLTQLI